MNGFTDHNIYNSTVRYKYIAPSSLSHYIVKFNEFRIGLGELVIIEQHYRLIRRGGDRSSLIEMINFHAPLTFTMALWHYLTLADRCTTNSRNAILKQIWADTGKVCQRNKVFFSINLRPGNHSVKCQADSETGAETHSILQILSGVIKNPNPIVVNDGVKVLY